MRLARDRRLNPIDHLPAEVAPFELVGRRGGRGRLVDDGGGLLVHAEGVLVGEAAHLQALRGLDQALELFLYDADFALVHEIYDGLHFPPAEVLQDDDRVLAGVLREYPLEEGRAGAEHHLVGADRRLGAHQRHIYQSLGLEEGVERRQDVRLMVVPSQRVVGLGHLARS